MEDQGIRAVQICKIGNTNVTSMDVYIHISQKPVRSSYNTCMEHKMYMSHKQITFPYGSYFKQNDNRVSWNLAWKIRSSGRSRFV